MNKNNLFFLILFTFLNVNAQEKKEESLDVIQGIWGNIVITEDDEHAYKIIKGINSLGISHTNNTHDLNFYLSEGFEGFQNYKYDEVDSIDITSLKNNGKYFTTIIGKNYVKKGWVKMLYCIIPEYFECNGGVMSINGGQLGEFYHIIQLPTVTLKLLYYRGKQDHRNYIKEYLNIEVVAITVPKSVIYTKPKQATANFLHQGDVVTVLEKKGKWLNIDYGGEQEGWIKKSDVEKQ